ncbi:SAG-related sequence [Besnoitia besnoiti]|uniref:SAG-related sequence n=1 Tax=Besnoitia besnoiti TaxID=94643 RepID=A0A2A9MI44_BESBE|nr:SAG-related sequence [Besnoitia besnoiti]PFH35626.1 SAG-related sequence [Besnoitia besnoiti]
MPISVQPETEYRLLAASACECHLQPAPGTHGGVLKLRCGEVGAGELHKGRVTQARDPDDSPSTPTSVAPCTLRDGSVTDSPDVRDLTLSEGKLIATLTFSGESFGAVPDSLKKVCQKQQGGEVPRGEDECEAGGTSLGKPVPLEGIPAPGRDYATKFFEREDLSVCFKLYSEIIPNFGGAWWTAQDAIAGVTLTIHYTHFPFEDTSLYVGCKPITTTVQQSSDSRAASAASEKNDGKPTTCKVVVTVKASGLFLTGGQGLGTAAAASGADVLTGLLGGSL